MILDTLVYATPSMLVAILVIVGVAWHQRKKSEKERDDLSRIIGAEIQFHIVYEKVYAQRSIEYGPDYTEFVNHVDKEPVKSNIDLERYWELVERYIGKTEEELRNEL